MRIRTYQPQDGEALAALFYETVHGVNGKDYTKEQLDVWAPGNVDLERWNASFLEHHTLVAEEDGQILGFGDMDKTGYLDRLYVHKDYQGRGIGAALVRELERWAALAGNPPGSRAFETYASITARPFFEHMGYQVVGENQVVRQGIRLMNYQMQKPCGKIEATERT